MRVAIVQERRRGLTGMERRVYAVAISFGLPSKPEAG